MRASLQVETRFGLQEAILDTMARQARRSMRSLSASSCSSLSSLSSLETTPASAGLGVERASQPGKATVRLSRLRLRNARRLR